MTKAQNMSYSVCRRMCECMCMFKCTGTGMCKHTHEGTYTYSAPPHSEFYTPACCLQNVQLGDLSDGLFNRGELDIHMMISLEGAERSEAQWIVMLAAAGFRLDSITRTRCPFSIVKAVPV